LAYEKLPINPLSKKSGINLPNFKPTVYQQLSKVSIPCRCSFFKSIERLIEFVYMVRKVGILESSGLLNIHFLF
jgi:hypothetical protein